MKMIKHKDGKVLINTRNINVAHVADIHTSEVNDFGQRLDVNKGEGLIILFTNKDQLRLNFDTQKDLETAIQELA